MSHYIVSALLSPKIRKEKKKNKEIENKKDLDKRREIK